MQIRPLPMVLLIATFAGIALGLGATDPVQRQLQQVKFGRPMQFCLEDVSVEASSDWRIVSLRRHSKGAALLAGLVPIPWLERQADGASANVVLVSDEQDVEISIHRTSNKNADGAVVDDCVANKACTLTVSPLDGASPAVEISAPSMRWFSYLNSPIMIGMQGGSSKTIQGVHVGQCKQARNT